MLLSGCQLPFLLLWESENIYSATKYIQNYKDNWQYNTLTDKEKSYYGQLYTAVMDTKDTESIATYTEDGTQEKQMMGVQVYLPRATLTQEQMTRLFEAFYRDNPQFFFLAREYRMGGHNNLKDEPSYDTILLQYTMNSAKRKTSVQAFTAKADQLLSDLTQTEDDYLTELYLHDKIAELCLYDEQAAAEDTEGTSNAYTAYGALVEGKAVCEGYAKAFQYLLHRVDIPATVVVGKSLSNTEAHMWNLVTINGENYFVDPTWNDIQNRVQHTYFNLTTEMLAPTHTIDKGQAAVLPCTATKDNYFYRNRTYIDTYSRDTIAKRFAARINAGDTIVELKFENSKYSNGLLFLKNWNLVEQKTAPYLTDGNTLWGYELFSNPDQCVLTLCKMEDS